MTAAAQPEENRVALLAWPDGAELVLENPYDFKPALDALMDKVKEVRATLPDQKLVIPIGEYHQIYALDRLQAEFIKALARHYPGQIAYGQEIRHNYGADFIKDINTETVKGREAYRTRQRELFLKDPDHVSYSMLKIKMTKALSVSMSMNDVAWSEFRDQSQYIRYFDLTDKETRDFTARMYGGIVPPQETLVRLSIDNLSSMREGLKVSNGFMAEKIGRYFSDTAAQIYVQACGAAHIAGYAEAGLDSPYGHSLTHALNEKDYAVLPVVLIPQNIDFVLPSEGYDILNKNGLIVKGLNPISIKDVSEAEQARYDATMGPLFDFS